VATRRVESTCFFIFTSIYPFNPGRQFSRCSQNSTVSGSNLENTCSEVQPTQVATRHLFGTNRFRSNLHPRVRVERFISTRLSTSTLRYYRDRISVGSSKCHYFRVQTPRSTGSQVGPVLDRLPCPCCSAQLVGHNSPSWVPPSVGPVNIISCPPGSLQRGPRIFHLYQNPEPQRVRTVANVMCHCPLATGMRRSQKRTRSNRRTV
jgi:hypothetical protein